MENLQENPIFDGANHGFLQILKPIPAVYIPKYIYIYMYIYTHTYIYMKVVINN